MPVQTRSMTKGESSSFSNKLFSLPLIDCIERKIRKQKNTMQNLSKSETFSASAIGNDDKLLTTTITLPSTSKQGINVHAETLGIALPPTLPPRSTEAQQSTLPLQEKETIKQNLNRFACTAFVWFRYVFFLLAVIGGLSTIHQIYQTFNPDKTMQAIILDEKSMTFKFTNLRIE